MDFDRMRYFCVVAKSGNIRKAAEELEISPSALSKAIRILESELGMPLLVQSGRGIRVSDEGKLLAQRSEEIVREVEELKELVRVRTVEAKPLKLGTHELFSTYFLRVLFSEEVLRIPVAIHDLLPGTLEQALVEGRIDLGLTLVSVPNADLDHFKVGNLPMGIFARKGAFPGYSFAEIPFVVPTKPFYGIPTLARGLDGWPDHQLVRRVRYQTGLLGSAIELCEMGLAAAYLPKFVARIHNDRVADRFQLRELAIPAGADAQSQPVYLVKRKSYVENEISRHLARAIRSLGKGSS